MALPQQKPAGPLYKVKLASGRILGPLDVERVTILILKNAIVGNEVAREYPNGEWKDINQIPELSGILLAKIEGRIQSEPRSASGYDPLLRTQISMEVLPGTGDGSAPTGSLGALPELATISESGVPKSTPPPGNTRTEPESGELDKTHATAGTAPSISLNTGSEAAKPAEIVDLAQEIGGEDDERTRVAEPGEFEKSSPSLALDRAVLDEAGVTQMVDEDDGQIDSVEGLDALVRKNISQEKTVVFMRTSESSSVPGKQQKGAFYYIKTAAVLVAVALVMNEFLDQPQPKVPTKFVPIKPRLPAYSKQADPQLSQKYYGEAMRDYIIDNVAGYTDAANKLLKSAGADVTNVKALAMLASSYLNLIDSSNKDGDYFAVISKLIDLSRAKAIDVPEAVIADVEFYVTANKAEAAENRIVEYTKTHQNFGSEMFFYLALAFDARGDARKAAGFLSQIPDAKAFTPKIFYLRGQVDEKLGDTESAMREYEKALKMRKDHAKSHLRIADLMNRHGQLKEAARHLEFITTHAHLLPPKDLALGYYLHAQLSELYQKWEVALGDVERAVKLDKDNQDYLLELYTLRAKVGESVASVRKDARMYYFLGEGEKLLREGKPHDALTQFLQAREANDASPIPPIKIGDMFSRLHDMGNAKLNYKLATDRAPNNIEVWSKYINLLIQSYEWEEAQKAMEKFRNLPVPQSAIDKAAADLYEKQGRHGDAQIFYKKAMERDTIDPDVYIAFAKSLMNTKNFKEAPFFFALALRFDPLNVDAIVGTAKCIAATDSVPRAISMLQDELTKSTAARAELLAAIAEFQIQQGNWDAAQQNVDQAMAADPEYAYPWKLQAQIHMNREGLDKDAIDKALAAYQSYSERNASDPSGYLERYKLFIKKTQFEAAAEELRKIYGVYPKYPNLHYFNGALYTAMGNAKAATQELKLELENNPNNYGAQIAYGKALADSGQADEALRIFNKLMLTLPGNAEAKGGAAYCNYLKRNYAAAVALFQAAIAIDQGNSLYYKRLGMAYRDMGDAAGASFAFRKYLEMEPDAPDRGEFEKYK
jgi:tetratricopeptide (TPR) repeat protein